MKMQLHDNKIIFIVIFIVINQSMAKFGRISNSIEIALVARAPGKN